MFELYIHRHIFHIMPQVPTGTVEYTPHKFRVSPNIMGFIAIVYPKLCLQAVVAGARAVSAPLPVVLFTEVLQKCLPPYRSLS
jgi:hypothetical protein